MARQRWANRTIFLLAALGSAVGLGNLWRFPYLAGKYGGGAFLLPYLIALVFVGVPLLMLEFAVGQKMQQGAIGSYKQLHRCLNPTHNYPILNRYGQANSNGESY